MAIDSAAKRASVIGVANPFMVAIIPDGTLDQADRQTVSLIYGGIAAAALTAVHILKINGVIVGFSPL